MPRIDPRDKKIAWIGAASVGSVIVGIAVVLQFQEEGAILVSDFVLIGVMLAIFPAAVLDVVDRRWKRGNDKNLPNLLRDIANAQRTGMTLAKALENAAERDYGPLSKNLKWAVAKMSWGQSYEEALKAMADRIDTSLSRKTVTLIIEVGRSGGNIQKLMETIAGHVRDLEGLERERMTQIKPYTYLIYIGFIVFIFSIGIVWLTFVKPILAEDVQIGPLTTQALPAEFYRTIFFHTSVIEGFFGGLIAGAMGEGSIGAGLKHALIMLVISLIAFTFVIV